MYFDRTRKITVKDNYETPACFISSCWSDRPFARPPIADLAYASIFAVEVRFQIRGKFWIPHPQPKLHGTCILHILKNQKNELAWSFLIFWQFLGKFDGSPLRA